MKNIPKPLLIFRLLQTTSYRTYLLAAVLSLLSVSCSHVSESEILELATSAELATAEYTVKKIVRASDSQWFTIGDRKIVFSVTAYLKAGVDLSALSLDKVLMDRESNSVKLILPHAKLISLNMPLEDAVLEYQQVGMLRSDFTAEDRNALLSQGEKSIRGDKQIMGSLFRDAEDNASLFFKTALSSLGFANVQVEFE